MDRLAQAAVADVDAYWEKAFPETFGGRKFEPVKRLMSYDSRGPGVQVCGESTQGLVNAFYCPTEDSIAWDRGELLPELNSTFGPMSAVAVIAHEMGHAVQHRAGTVSGNDATIVLEQQADCFAGAYMRHVAEKNSEYFQVSTGNGLNSVMGVLNNIRDGVGTDFAKEGAHGSAFDRVTAFQYGFGEGPKRCAKMDAADVKQRTTAFKFWKEGQEQDLPVTAETVAAVEQSLQDVFHDTGAEPPTVTTEPASCPGTKPTSPASYCPDTNTVSVDMAALQKIGKQPDPANPDPAYGDFAAYAQVASRYVMSIQKAAGMSLDDEAAGLRTACLVGSWTGLLVEDPIGQRNPVGKVRIAPGDVDEGVSALLGEDSLIAANLGGQQVPAGFARVDAFRVGFQEGTAPCSARYGG
ncbi:neutral zinc metallopeptidase, partial [Saccharopolyspora taberi]|uniref:Neutral zinc metallopeptidase n=1 Tax=Saccharopolyspora taberi TaxID=60895 RepID=A0ABN3V607_9PSEU